MAFDLFSEITSHRFSLLLFLQALSKGVKLVFHCVNRSGLTLRSFSVISLISRHFSRGAFGTSDTVEILIGLVHRDNVQLCDSPWRGVLVCISHLSLRWVHMYHGAFGSRL